MRSKVIGWVGMTLTLSGVAIQSLLPELLRFSFPLFFLSALVWFTNGLLTKNRPLACTQAVLIILNIIAVIHYWFT